VPCHAISFKPANEAGENLYSGKIWIDPYNFRRVRVSLDQKGFSGNISACEEIQEYELITDGQGNSVNLLRSVVSNQQLIAAGRNFLLEKRYKFSGFRINNSSFHEMLDTAHNRKNPMFRDTDQGLRELKIKDDERILVANLDTRTKSIVTGLVYEGTYDYPIPMFGYSLVDFDFMKTGHQLSLFFAGPILAANMTRQWPNNFRLGYDLALSAVPGENRIYADDQEVEEETFQIWEESIGIRAAWQSTTRLSFTIANYLTYNHYKDPDKLNDTYLSPRNGFSLIPTFETEYSNRGYKFVAGTSYFRRFDWRGFGTEPDKNDNSYLKYFGKISKSIYFGSFTKAGVELVYFGGENLDRFSRYSPSFFTQPTIKGIPGGTDTFDNIGVASAGFGFNAMEFIKFEATYSHAWAQNKSESNEFRNFDGIEFGFGTIGPWGTYCKGAVSYALNGNLDRYDSRWSLNFLVFIPLGTN